MRKAVFYVTIEHDGLLLASATCAAYFEAFILLLESASSLSLFRSQSNAQLTDIRDHYSTLAIGATIPIVHWRSFRDLTKAPGFETNSLLEGQTTFFERFEDVNLAHVPNGLLRAHRPLCACRCICDGTFFQPQILLLQLSES